MENWIDGFLESQGWNAPVVTDENLMMEYPACVYTFADGRRVIALAPEMEEAVPAIHGIQSQIVHLQGAERFVSHPSGDHAPSLDLSEITVHPERVTGFYAPADFPANGEELPDADEAGLRALMDAVSEEDRARGEVTAQDDFTCCIVENGRMLAAAGAVAENGIADISVLVRPDARGRGLGAQTVSALIRKIRKAGLETLYRAENDNLPSMRLAEKIGLARGFVMDGALLVFPL